jgi:streptogramin lyase
LVTIAQSADGDIWAGCLAQGVFRLDIRAGVLGTKTTCYDTTKGMLGVHPVNVALVRGKPLFFTDSGSFAFDQVRQRLYPDTIFWKNFVTPMQEQPDVLFEYRFGDIWMRQYTTEEFGRVWTDSRQRNHFEYFPFSRLSGTSFDCMYRDDDGRLWFGGMHGVYRYDPGVSTTYQQPFRTFVSTIELDNATLYPHAGEGSDQHPFEVG